MITTNTIIKHRIAVLCLVALVFQVTMRAQQFAVGNNLVYSAALTPNLSLETRLDSSWTLGIAGGFRPWPTDDTAQRKYRHFSIDLYGRKWTEGTPWRGWFYGYDALWVHYNLSNLKMRYFGMFGDARHHRIQGNVIGVGSFGGYAWDLGSGFGIDVQGGADLAWTHYRMYDCVHCGSPVARKNRVYLLPKVSVDVSWRF